MKKLTVFAIVVLLGVMANPAISSASSSTPPVQIKSTSRLYAADVSATVTMDTPGTITLTNRAYRHPEQTQATVIATEPGVYVIRDFCQPYRLPHEWVVYVDGVEVAATGGLRCR